MTLDKSKVDFQLNASFDQFEYSDQKSESGAPVGIIKGIASTTAFNVPHKIIVEPYAFSESISKKGLKGGNAIRLLYEHDPKQVLGRIDKLEYIKQGQELSLEASILLNTQIGKEKYELTKECGAGLSVGFTVIEPVYNDKVLHVKKGNLNEVSLTLFPSNDDCIITTCLSNLKKELQMPKDIDEVQLKTLLSRIELLENQLKTPLDIFNFSEKSLNQIKDYLLANLYFKTSDDDIQNISLKIADLLKNRLDFTVNDKETEIDRQINKLKALIGEK